MEVSACLCSPFNTYYMNDVNWSGSKLVSNIKYDILWGLPLNNTQQNFFFKSFIMPIGVLFITLNIDWKTEVASNKKPYKQIK